MQVAPNRVTVDEFNRWAAPLDESIARTVAGDLAVLLGTPRVATGPLANFEPAYRVTIDVQRFDSIPGRKRRSTRSGWCAGRRAVRRGRGAPSRASRCRARASTPSPRRTAGLSRR